MSPYVNFCDATKPLSSAAAPSRSWRCGDNIEKKIARVLFFHSEDTC